MKYNGIELTEMLPENWDGKTREMLVWCAGSPEPSLLTVIGYDSMGWIDCETLTHWTHCAEIPTGSVEGLNRSLKYAYNALEIRNKQIENLEKENKELEAKLEAFGELHKVAELVQYTINKSRSEKKFRRMTYKELSEWLAKGNGQYKNGNFGSFRTELVYCKNEENTIVENDCLIRGFNEDTWHEPLIKA